MSTVRREGRDGVRRDRRDDDEDRDARGRAGDDLAAVVDDGDADDRDDDDVVDDDDDFDDDDEDFDDDQDDDDGHSRAERDAPEDEVERVEELLAYVARALVDHPREVEVQSVEGDKTLVFELVVAQRDLGKVIGREGRTARALRTVLNASASRLGKRAILEILE